MIPGGSSGTRHYASSGMKKKGNSSNPSKTRNILPHSSQGAVGFNVWEAHIRVRFSPETKFDLLINEVYSSRNF